jgi:pheromone shutdown protein TraB
MFEMPESRSRSTRQVALGFLLGMIVSLSCLFISVLLGAALGLNHAWMFPLLNGVALLTAGLVALRRVHSSSYPEGVLIALSVAFVFNVVIFLAALSGYVE